MTNRKAVAAVAGCFLVAPVIFVLIQLLGADPLPARGEYFLTELGRQNYGFIAWVLFAGIGFQASYWTRANPLVIGAAMVAYFPIVAVYEGVAFRGSHNLLPFEAITWPFLAIPPTGGAFAGWLAARVVPEKDAPDELESVGEWLDEQTPPEREPPTDEASDS